VSIRRSNLSNCAWNCALSASISESAPWTSMRPGMQVTATTSAGVTNVGCIPSFMLLRQGRDL
jgi:hypothetical protein